ncbi:MAG: hypothetical protein ACI9TV_000842 [Sulfurimonas sp.]|jgi:hypothetical protein|uniref:GIY-YIG nuclease family protein n=1 Tax=Sulfurimonas sp. TaxID=2022749 RepID=UPI0039E64CC0
MDKKKILDDILANDPFGLLDSKAKNPIITEEDRLVSSFEDVNDFYEKNGCEPKKSTDINERSLFSRLQGMRDTPTKRNLLKKYDKFNLLSGEDILEINSIDDIFNNDALGLLENDAEDIFTLKHVPKVDKDRKNVDYLSRRSPYKDFATYEPIFIQCQKDLKSETRELEKFTEESLKEGNFFILKNVLVYLKEIGERTKDKYHKVNARTTLIFENGTYSNMLLRSLTRILYDGGYVVSERKEIAPQEITSEDKQNGYIYIVSSLSNDDRISTKSNLFKIGFSTTEVEIRIKNAKKDPTYLMSEIQTVASYEVYNVNPHKLEQLIHKFFSNTCLDIDIVDEKGRIHRPREWFVAPLDVIEEAIDLIINGKIINYHYNELSEQIELK